MLAWVGVERHIVLSHIILAFFIWRKHFSIVITWHCSAVGLDSWLTDWSGKFGASTLHSRRQNAVRFAFEPVLSSARINNRLSTGPPLLYRIRRFFCTIRFPFVLTCTL